MSTIKFSREYPKLLDNKGYLIRRARLLAVLEVEISDLPAEFLAYDTGNGLYDLPVKGIFLMLLFVKPDGINLFTTLRRSTPEKLRWYRSQIGERLDVQVSLTNQTADAP